MGSPIAVVVAGIAFAVLLPAKRASADDAPRPAVDWSRVVDALRDGLSLLRGSGEEQGGPHACGHARRAAAARVSLVARDWDGAQRLIGPLALTDRIRLDRSTRMLVVRVHAGGGPLAPFVQAGVGQMRANADGRPAPADSVKLAGQLGAGFDLSLGPAAAVALETDETVPWRLARDAAVVSGPQVWGLSLAARAAF